METNMLEATSKENLMEKENINGLMEVIMKVILWMVFVKGKENGHTKMVQCTKVNLKMISKMDMESKNTNQDKFLKEYSRREINLREIFSTFKKMW